MLVAAVGHVRCHRNFCQLALKIYYFGNGGFAGKFKLNQEAARTAKTKIVVITNLFSNILYLKFFVHFNLFN